MNENQPPQPPGVDPSGVFNADEQANEAVQLQLDTALDRLAQRYASQPASAQAEEETLKALKTFTHVLSDDELEWLAAAGPSGPVAGNAPNPPLDPQTPGKPKP